MPKTLGSCTWMRCAVHMGKFGTKPCELSHERSNEVPQSPFHAPLVYEYRPTVGNPGTKHAFNGEHVTSGEPRAQGMQMDTLGHCSQLGEPWSGEGEYPAGDAIYYGGKSQAEVKSAPDAPVQQLRIEQAPPIVTSAVLLDAAASLDDVEPLDTGTMVTAADINLMIEEQGPSSRRIVLGDVLLIHTDWGRLQDDAEASKQYFYVGPSLVREGAKLVAEKKGGFGSPVRAVAIGAPA